MLEYLSYPDIKAFILSNKATEIYATHQNHVAEFCVGGKNKLVTNTPVLEEMNIKFEFLKNLAQMDQYTDDVLIDETSRQAQVDCLLKHAKLLKADLDARQKEYPDLWGTTLIQTPLNTPMGELIRDLRYQTQHYISIIQNKLDNAPAWEYQKELYSDHIQFTNDLKAILNNPKYAQLYQPNTMGYWIYCQCIFAIRSFLRLFDIIFHCGNTLNSHPEYVSFFYYPQSTLKPIVEEIKTNIENHLSNCEKSLNLK